MSVFADTNVFVYAVAEGDAGVRARDLLAAAADGELDLVTSTAVAEEVWHLELSGRIPALAGQARRVRDLMAPLLPIDDTTFARALDLRVDGLGANDRLHLACCLEHGAERILTADRAFDGVPGVQRVDPLAQDALALLRGP